MKLLFLGIFISFSFSAESSVLLKEVKSSNGRIIYYDYNNDSKADLIEYFEKEILVKKERDENYDGIIDEKIEYFKYVDEKKPFEIITHKNQIKKIYRNEKLKIIIQTIEIDKNADGIYELKYTENYPIVQKSQNCSVENYQNVVSRMLQLNNSVSSAIEKLTSRDLKSAFGHKIHQSCFNNYPNQNFSKIVTDTISEGLQCIEQLARKNIKETPRGPNGALTNLVNLNRLMKETPVTIVCHEKDYPWDGVLGHASTSRLDVIESLGVKHPYISLAPRDSTKSGGANNDEIMTLKKTIFHEQFHNLGFRHGSDVEYAYACEDCCFNDSNPANNGQIEKNAACKVCRGQYKSTSGMTKEYLVDLIDWGEKRHDSAMAEKMILSYLKENPKNNWGIAAFANSNSGVFSAVGIELAKIVRARIPNLNAEDQQNINQSQTYAQTQSVQNISREAKVIADGFYHFYYLNDPGKALEFINNQKSILRKIRKNAQDTNLSPVQIYTNEKLDEDMRKLLSDLWYNNYPETSNSVATKAFKLMEELKYFE